MWKQRYHDSFENINLKSNLLSLWGELDGEVFVLWNVSFENINLKNSLTSSWGELDGDVLVGGVEEAGVEINPDGHN